MAIAADFNIPRTALVRGGNWEGLAPPHELTPSLESRIRVMALGILAEQGLVDTAIFTAGLTKGGVPEAEAQDNYLQQYFPAAASLRRIRESLGHATKADAHYTAEIVEQQSLEGPYALIASECF